MVRVPVKHHVDGVAIERLFEAARAQVGKDLEGLSFHGGADRRVVEHGDALRGSQPCQCAFEFHGFVDRFLHEALGSGLSPCSQGCAAEAAGEAFRAGDPRSSHLIGLAVEHFDAGRREDFADFDVLAGFVVVIAEHADDGNVDHCGQLAHEDVGFLGKSVIREVAAQQEDVRLIVDGSEQRLQRTLRRLFDMQVADGG
jgi:hypothetical protein